MTSIKKLSIAAVVALAAATLSVAPASANVQTLAVSGVTQTTGNTSATAIALPVVDADVATSNVLNIDVSSLSAGATVSAVATNALLVSTTSAATAASGSATLTLNATTSGTVDIYVFTKTSAVGSVVVTVGNTVTTYYVKGVAGALTKVTATAPATGLNGSTQSVVVSAFDKYDNAKGSATVSLVINTNGVITTASVNTNATGTASHVVTLPSSGSVTVTAFAASSSAVATINVTQPRNIEAELTAALGTVATLTANLATANTATADALKELRKLKWQYNKLVQKYNVGKPKAERLAFIK